MDKAKQTLLAVKDLAKKCKDDYLTSDIGGTEFADGAIHMCEIIIGFADGCISGMDINDG